MVTEYEGKNESTTNLKESKDGLENHDIYFVEWNLDDQSDYIDVVREIVTWYVIERRDSGIILKFLNLKIIRWKANVLSSMFGIAIPEKKIERKMIVKEIVDDILTEVEII